MITSLKLHTACEINPTTSKTDIAWEDLAAFTPFVNTAIIRLQSFAKESESS